MDLKWLHVGFGAIFANIAARALLPASLDCMDSAWLRHIRRHLTNARSPKIRRPHRIKKTIEIDPIQAETVRLIFRLAREGSGSSGRMGVKSIATHLNASGIRTRDGGRWGVDAVHKVLTRTTYIGRHRFNTKFWKTRERKAETEILEMAGLAIVDKDEFEVVQMLLKSRSPAMVAPRVISGQCSN